MAGDEDDVYHCNVCGGTSSKCYRCDNVVGEDADGEPVECGADLVGKNTSTAGIEDA